jgi:hypothetical protein
MTSGNCKRFITAIGTGREPTLIKWQNKPTCRHGNGVSDGTAE